MRRDITPAPSPCFYYTTSARLAKRFPWHVLSKQRSCSPYSRIPINTDMGNPTVPVATPPPSKASSKRSALGILPLYNETKALPFLQSLIESAPRPEFQHPRLQIQALRTFDNVRLQPTRPVDAFFRHERRHAKAERRQVSNWRNFA